MTVFGVFLVVLISILLAGLLLQIVTRLVTLLIGTFVKLFGGKFNAKKFNSGLFRGIIWFVTALFFFAILGAALWTFGVPALIAAGAMAVLVILCSVLSRWFRWVWKQD
ncbi:MAG: hypothetical protein J6S40_10280 [Thermoguttaceae bacterium]|nr:hypothetical protein [Thermoguttaceae bacterium]